MDKLLPKAFDESAQFVLKNLANIAIEPYDYSSEKDGPINSYINGSVGMIGICKVSVMIGFDKEAIYKLHIRMFPEDSSNITFSSLGDLVGEITNMICGRARGQLSEQGITFDASIPIAIIGERQYIHSPTGTVIKILPYKMDGNKMFIEIIIKE